MSLYKFRQQWIAALFILALLLPWVAVPQPLEQRVNQHGEAIAALKQATGVLDKAPERIASLEVKMNWLLTIGLAILGAGGWIGWCLKRARAVLHKQSQFLQLLSVIQIKLEDVEDRQKDNSAKLSKVPCLSGSGMAQLEDPKCKSPGLGSGRMPIPDMP